MTWNRYVYIAAVWGIAVGLAACSTQKPEVDPLTTLASRAEVAHTRLDALKAAQAQAASDPTRRDANQRVYRDIAWTYSEPVSLRIAVLQALVDDLDAKAAADAKETIKLLLPRERALEVVRFACRTAAERGWDDCIPSLIRSYSRTPASLGWVGVNNEVDRPERAAIEVLSKGTPIEKVVFQAFLKPPAQTSSYGVDWAQRFRADAWDLLARLDTDGTMRVSMLSDVPDASADDLIMDIHRCVRELRSMPRTGDELRWLMALVDPKKRENALWWAQAAKAIASIGEDGDLSALCHAEAIRWAASKHPEWLQASRKELLSELRTRISRRTIHERTAESGLYRVHEQLVDWEAKLRWGDLISILAIDEALRAPSVVRALATQAELDRKDTTTEYGGVLMLRSAMGGNTVPRASEAEEEWIAMLFPPRAGQREGDEKFIASEDMIAASDLSLAHYHLHAQKSKNAEFAGPSPGDLIYAARSGRACLVLTPISVGRMDADYYQSDGVVIDLGEVGER